MKPRTEVIGLSIAVTALILGSFWSGRRSVNIPPPSPPPSAYVTVAGNGIRVTVDGAMLVVRYGAAVPLVGGRWESPDSRWTRTDSAGVEIGDGIRFTLRGGSAR